MGKHKPIYDPSTDCGDYVVAVGCHDLRTTGKKRFQKKYYSHTTRPGSLKSMTMDMMFAKWGGGEVLRRAVRGMLPKNRLRDRRLARLKSMLPSFCLWPGRPGLYGGILTIAAFEGVAHPYKSNIVRFGNQPVLPSKFPEVQEAFKGDKTGP